MSTEKKKQTIRGLQFSDEARRGIPKVTLPKFKFLEKKLDEDE